MAAQKLPSVIRQLIVKKLGTNFREVTEISSSPLPQLGARDILIKNRYVGVNASDINFTAGRYDVTLKPPFPVGFEGVGEVVSVGADATNIKPGQYVAYMKNGAFSDYMILPEKHAMPVPVCDPGVLSLLVSGLTASIALDKEGELKKGENVLITAAAGGTGQIAVQLAKLAGCHVIGTCSSDEKANFLKDIGCDRPVNYKKEALKDVLKKEYPGGVDVVYESVGGEMFETALKNLSLNGRMIIIGLITTYEGKPQKEKGMSASAASMILLTKSASMRGFFLFRYMHEIPPYLAQLAQLYTEGKLKVSADLGRNASSGPFQGLEKIADAVEYLYTGKSVGKVVVELNRPVKSSL